MSLKRVQEENNLEPTKAPRLDTFTSNTHRATYAFIDPLCLNLAGTSVLLIGDGLDTIAHVFARAGARLVTIAMPSLDDEVKFRCAIETQAAVRYWTAGKTPFHFFIKKTTFKQTQKEADELMQHVQEQYDGKLDVLIADYREISLKLTGSLTRFLQQGSLKTFICLAPWVHPSDVSEGLRIRLSAMLQNYNQASWNRELVIYAVRAAHVMTVAENTKDDLRSDSKKTLTADTICWLASEHRTWLNGRLVDATWDMKEFLDKKDEVVNKDLLNFLRSFR